MDLCSCMCNQKIQAWDFCGQCGSAPAFSVSGCIQDGHKSGLHLFVTRNEERAYAFYGDFISLLQEDKVFFLPTTYKKLDRQSDASYSVQRTMAYRVFLSYLRKEAVLPYAVLVTYPRALEEPFHLPSFLEEHNLHFTAGDRYGRDFLKEKLTENGFKCVDFVDEPGQFAIRGSIIDVFSYTCNLPYRISFFDDCIENIRTFDANTQTSIEKLESIDLVPALEGRPEAMTALWPLLPPDCTLWFEDASQYASLPASLHPKKINSLPHNFAISPQPAFNKNFELLVRDIEHRKDSGYTCWIAGDNPAQHERLKAIFAAQKKGLHFFESIPVAFSEGFVDGNSKICVYTDHQIFERFHRVFLQRAVKKSERLSINDLTDFKLGDYIVHIDYGVGVFGGLVSVVNNGKRQEMLRIVYANNDTLLVNIHALHKISRYKSKEGSRPKIYPLGSKTWQSLKRRTKSRLKDIAAELIQLYARRKAAEGYAFSPDTYLQHELEASFVFEDTPDQIRATSQIKQDMERPCPMDRLICGDVGFGKTEVAIRAAFKAVLDGKQVAVLVPTTLLALQHYQTFTRRLEKFSVDIALVSRLKKPGEVKEIIESLRLGKVDIIIGTHRILNKDVLFKDLGLLIVDEEQKFGVGAKERLRRLKLNVDTLTLTATPIPRTLQFSLMGARDISFLQTPPPNRLPIHTEIEVFNPRHIKQAIDYEVQRGGQIFFVHNRVEDIDSIADILRAICPNIRIAVGHGQMPPRDLEKTMLDFIYGDYDLLLATTIIENGIDIPNVNTIIINQAQQFGLSDLHQMRGRVGRSNVQAYCYLLVPSLQILTEDARKRLKAIEAFQELGSGFNIAMQDLDIRGAGNLLGGEQSGFIAEMGFEAYQRILNEALAELNASLPADRRTEGGGETVYISDCSIETDLELFIPNEYISYMPEKMRLYRELNNIRDDETLQRFFADLEDRFGPIPEPLRQLGFVVKLRRLAVGLGFERIVIQNGIMLAYFITNQMSNYYKTPLFSHILQYIQNHPKYFKVKEQNNKLYLKTENIQSVEQAFDVLSYFVKP